MGLLSSKASLQERENLITSIFMDVTRSSLFDQFLNFACTIVINNLYVENLNFKSDSCYFKALLLPVFFFFPYDFKMVF